MNKWNVYTKQMLTIYIEKKMQKDFRGERKPKNDKKKYVP